MRQRYRPRSRCPEEEFVRAVAENTTIADVLRRLGLDPSGSNYKFVHHWVRRLSLDTSHWRGQTEWPSDEEFAQAVAESSSAAQVARRFGLKYNGTSHRYLRMAIERLSLDTSHWLGQAHLRGKTHNWTDRIPLAEILVENSTYGSTSRLKLRLIQAGMLKPCCQMCGISDWHGKPLALVLDHVNGIFDDNRIENIRLLCPNCHSQTPTFAGRNKGRRARALTGEAGSDTIQAR
jgi:hypothetical protein